MNNFLNIEVGVFNITNVCNLSCNSCETYNDRKFKGHSFWKDYENDYVEWSKKLNIDSIIIIGGEPYSNSDLSSWVNGLKSLWPKCNDMQICTNGTYLTNQIQSTRDYLEKGFWLDISCHNPEHLEKIKLSLEKILENYNYKIVQENNQYTYFADDRKLVRLYTAYNFRKTSQKFIKNGTTYMHDSDIEKAHDLCINNLGQCYTFSKGKLYKCHLTAISNDLINQFRIEDRAVTLLKSYKSCSPWDQDHEIEFFIKNLSKAIPQCNLCPEKETVFPIWPMNNKK